MQRPKLARDGGRCRCGTRLVAASPGKLGGTQVRQNFSAVASGDDFGRILYRQERGIFPRLGGVVRGICPGVCHRHACDVWYLDGTQCWLPPVRASAAFGNTMIEALVFIALAITACLALVAGTELGFRCESLWLLAGPAGHVCLREWAAERFVSPARGKAPALLGTSTPIPARLHFGSPAASRASGPKIRAGGSAGAAAGD